MMLNYHIFIISWCKMITFLIIFCEFHVFFFCFFMPCNKSIPNIYNICKREMSNKVEFFLLSRCDSSFFPFVSLQQFQVSVRRPTKVLLKKEQVSLTHRLVRFLYFLNSWLWKPHWIAGQNATTTPTKPNTMFFIVAYIFIFYFFFQISIA